MTQASAKFRIQDGVVTTEPAGFDEAIEVVAQQKLRGVMVRDDFADKRPNPPVVDLSRLLTVPFIDDFGMSPGLNPKRFAHFEALYQMRKLRKLGMHSYARVDLSNFPKVEMLFLTDGPNCAGLESLSHLQYWPSCQVRDQDGGSRHQAKPSIQSRIRKGRGEGNEWRAPLRCGHRQSQGGQELGDGDQGHDFATQAAVLDPGPWRQRAHAEAIAGGKDQNLLRLPELPHRRGACGAVSRLAGTPGRLRASGKLR